MADAHNHQLDSGNDAATLVAARNDILRARRAVTTLLVALLILLLAAGLAGIGESRSRHRAQQAEAAGQVRLAEAYLSQARATRLAVQPDRRQLSLNAISNAAAISTSIDLRSEAAACLALTDLELAGPLVTTPHVLNHLAMSANLKYCGWVEEDKKITISVASGRETYSFMAGQPVLGLSFSPDGHWLAVRQPAGQVAIYDLQSKQFLKPVMQQSGVIISFSDDSQQMIFSGDDSNRLVTVCALPECTLAQSSIPAGAQHFRASHDLQKLAVCNGTDVDIYDFPNGSNRMVLPHNSRALVVAWSGDGNKLAVACEDGDIHLWDLPRQSHNILTGHSALILTLGFSDNGRWLFSSSQDGITRLWDTALGKTIAVGQGIGQTISADGRQLGFWRPWMGYGVWDISASRVYSVLPCDLSHGPLFNLDLSSNGRWCVAMQNNGFMLWDLNSDDQGTFYPARELYDLCFSKDDRSLVMCRETGIEFWPLKISLSGHLELQSADRKIRLPDGKGARAAALSADNHFAAVELTDQRLMVLDLEGTRPPVIFANQWQHFSFRGGSTATGAGRFAMSPDGKWVVTGFYFGEGGGVKVWDATTGKLVESLSPDSSQVVFSPDGRWLGLAAMNGFSFRSVGDWKQKAGLNRNETAVTHGALAFGFGSTTAAFGKTHQMIEIGDFLSNNNLIDLISPEPQSINATRLSRNGSTLVTATANNLVEVWQLDRLQAQLAAMGLNRKISPTATVREPATFWSTRSDTLIFVAALVGFIVAGRYSLTTLRRYRLVVEQFLAAEARSAQRRQELNQAKIELVQSQKMQALGTLATGIAHDFNNLLSVIRMSNKLIGRRNPVDPRIREHVADIEQAVLQGKSVVGSMLGYAKNHDNKGGAIDVATLVEDVVALLSKEFLSGIVLELKSERALPGVCMGRGAMEQILLNLVVNASEAMQGKGTLSIGIRETMPSNDVEYVLRPRDAGSHVALTVTDTGPGIAPELRHRIFEPFFTTKSGGAKPGTGLGLSLVYSLAEQGGCGLTVNPGPDGGAAFTLFLPVEPAGPVRQTHTPTTDRPPVK